MFFFFFKQKSAYEMRISDWSSDVCSSDLAHGYSASKGIPGLRRAQASYYARRFGVELDPETEVVVTLGSKEGLANLAQAITAPGDVVLAPNPSYPIHTFGFIIAGATIRSVPTTPDERYWESLDRAIAFRSEEHTSELQSLMRTSYAVFCLKKNNTQSNKNDHTS